MGWTLYNGEEEEEISLQREHADKFEMLTEKRRVQVEEGERKSI